MTHFTDKDIQQRAESAETFFRNGYNCAQSVFMAYCDCYNISQEQAAVLAGSFGGGMGRMREVCGAVSGMCFIAGQTIPLAEPATTPQAKQDKTDNYALFQSMAKEFKNECGSIICHELLHVEGTQSPTPDERNANYYKKRPCVELVKLAAHIAGKKLQTLSETQQQ